MTITFSSNLESRPHDIIGNADKRQSPRQRARRRLTHDSSCEQIDSHSSVRCLGVSPHWALDVRPSIQWPWVKKFQICTKSRPSRRNLTEKTHKIIHLGVPEGSRSKIILRSGACVCFRPISPMARPVMPYVLEFRSDTQEVQVFTVPL